MLLDCGLFQILHERANIFFYQVLIMTLYQLIHYHLLVIWDFSRIRDISQLYNIEAMWCDNALEMLYFVGIISLINVLVVRVEFIVAFRHTHIVFNNVWFIMKLLWCAAFEHIVYNIISHCFKRFMSGASVLINAQEIQLFDVSRPWCLLECVWWFYTFTADVDEGILEVLNIIKIGAMYDRWWVNANLFLNCSVAVVILNLSCCVLKIQWSCIVSGAFCLQYS